MGKNQSASGLTNIIQYDNNGNVSFVSGSTTLMQISSSGAITTTGVISGSNALSASYSLNSGLLNGTGSVGFATTASLLTVSSSQQQISASQQQLSSSFLILTASYTALSSSYTALSGSYNTFSGSNSEILTAVSSSNQQLSASYISLSGSYNTFSGSASTRVTQIENVYATTGSNSFRATQSITGSLTVTGQIIAQTLNVQQVTSSIIYSSGSNNFGCDLNSRQTFTGSVLITGSLTIAGASSATSYSGTTIFGSTIACSPIGCFSTSCATAFIGGTMSGTTIYGSTAVCSPVGLFSGCVNIGTAGSEKLNIFGAGSQFINVKNTTSNADMFVGMSSALAAAFIGTGGTDPIVFSTAGSEKMRITNGGNVGIGCTTPGQSLTVQSSGVATYLKSTATADSATYGNFQMYRQACKVGNGVGFALGLINSAAVDTEYAYIGTLIESCTSTQECGAIGFYTTAAGNGRCERLRITSAGNVGMGITSPDYKLHISTATKGIGVNEAGVVISSNESLAANIGGTLGFGATSDYGMLTIAKVGGYRENATGTSASSYLAFETRSGGNAVTERMRITSAGSVVIGNTTAYGGLTVSDFTANDGNDAISLFYRGTSGGHESLIKFYDFRGQVNASIGNSLEDDGSGTQKARLVFKTACNGAPVERMRIAPNGVVRMGTCAINANTNSNVALQVAGAIRFGNPDGDYVTSYGGGISARALSLSPGSATIIIKGLGGSGFLYQVQGFTGTGKRFTDLVMGINTILSVVHSVTEATPATRSYTITSENLNLCLSGADTYNIISHGFGAVER